MRVHIYKHDDGTVSLMIVPGRKAHLAPILIKGVTRDKIKGQVAKMVRDLKGAPVILVESRGSTTDHIGVGTA